MPALEMPALTADEIDDLLYFTRVNEADELQETLSELSRKSNCSKKDVVRACVDPESGNTVLHYASANGFAELLRTLLAILEIKSEDASAGDGGSAVAPSFIDTANKEGNTPLHWASVNGQLDVVKILVHAGADVSKENLAGYLAVSEAERAGKGNVVEYLIDRGPQELSAEDVVDGANGGDDSNGTHHVNGNEDADMNG